MAQTYNQTLGIVHKVFASLSQHVYEPEQSSANLFGFKLLEESSNALNDTVAAGYYSAAYVYQQTIILAHRGTDSKDDLKADWHLVTGECTTQFEAAKKFYQHIKSTYPNHTIIQTGHSLGAVLAEILAFFNKTPAVTFDSPGAYTAIKACSDKQIQATAAELTQQCDITTYLTAPSFINTMDDHVGTIYRLFNTVNTDLECPLKESWFYSAAKAVANFNTPYLPTDEFEAYCQFQAQQHDIESIARTLTSKRRWETYVASVQTWPTRQTHALIYYQTHTDHTIALNEHMPDINYHISELHPQQTSSLAPITTNATITDAITADITATPALATAAIIASILISAYVLYQQTKKKRFFSHIEPTAFASFAVLISIAQLNNAISTSTAGLAICAALTGLALQQCDTTVSNCLQTGVNTLFQKASACKRTSAAADDDIEDGHRHQKQH